MPHASTRDARTTRDRQRVDNLRTSDVLEANCSARACRRTASASRKACDLLDRLVVTRTKQEQPWTSRNAQFLIDADF
jgi:hypothetical protein